MGGRPLAMTLDRACLTAAYWSENKAPAAQLNCAGAVRLSPPLTNDPSYWSLGPLSSNRRVLIVLAVIPIEEPNRPDVTGAYPPLPNLVLAGTHGIASGINCLTGWQPREISIPRRAIIGKRVEARVAHRAGSTARVAGPLQPRV